MSETIVETIAIFTKGSELYSIIKTRNMSLRDKMTPKTDEQLYEALLKTKEPNLIHIVYFEKENKLFLIRSLIDDPNLEPALREKWNELLNDKSNQMLNELDAKTNEIFVQFMQDANLDPEIIRDLLNDPGHDIEIE